MSESVGAMHTAIFTTHTRFLPLSLSVSVSLCASSSLALLAISAVIQGQVFTLHRRLSARLAALPLPLT